MSSKMSNILLTLVYIKIEYYNTFILNYTFMLIFALIALAVLIWLWLIISATFRVVVDTNLTLDIKEGIDIG